ncbi:MAG: murein transglycosylase, partial [Epsilonproteobacteria bacterium]
MKTLILIALSSTMLWGAPTYTNCDFKTKPYEKLCDASVKIGISVQYVNEFLLSEKAKARDFKSFRLFQPKMLKTHHANEKRANNSLVKFVPKIVVHLKTYEKVYDAAEKKYRVNREIIAAIFAKETRLGIIKPKHDAFTVFNTLLVESKTDTKREKWLVRMAHNNMISIMQFCYNNKITPNQCDFAS